MIQTDEQWAQTREALLHLERGLRALNQDRSRLHPDRYRLMAEPILDDIFRLRAEIDHYIGLPTTLTSGARPLPAEDLAGVVQPLQQAGGSDRPPELPASAGRDLSAHVVAPTEP